MYVFGVVLESPFEEAVARVKEALGAEKLGLVSEVDVGGMLRAKLGEDIGGYRILGACAPALAWRVIQAQPAAGALLPCNVVIRAINADSTAVDFMDPVSVLALARTPEIDAVAAEARAILERARDRLSV
jgi:uncharacterized protein (DUF302 family)